jgi:LPXTG-motif cell wall-anchored protein
MKSLRMLFAITAIAVLAVVGLAGAAGAQSYTPDEPQTSVLGTGVSDTANDAGVASATAASATAASGTLPYTGSNDTLPFLQIGIVLLAAGGATVLFVRHRAAKAEA